MSRQNAKRVNRKMTAGQKMKYAKLRRQVEQEFPSGKMPQLAKDGSEPPTMGDYFDLRFVVSELRKARETQGLSLADVEQRTGIQRSAISRIENGENVNPTINTLTRYARALGRRIEIKLVEVEAVEVTS